MRIIIHALAAALLTLASSAAHAAVPPIPPNAPLPPKIALPGTRMTWLSDSRGCFSQWAPTGANAGYRKSVADVLTWAEDYSGGALVYDQINAPPGTAGTIIDLKVVPDANGNPQGGSNYTSPTISIPFATGFAATAILSGGHIIGATVTNPGAVPSSSVTSSGITITDSTGSGAVLTPVLGGKGTFCAGGTKLPELRARLPDIITGKYGPQPDILVVFGGHNDMSDIVTGTVSVRTMLTHAMAIIKSATNAGMIVAWMIETPTDNNALSGYTSAQQNQFRQQMDQYNTGLRLMSQLDPTLNPSKTKFILIDGSKYLVDGSALSNGGQSAPYRLQDGLHLSQWGGMILGRMLERSLRPYYNTAVARSYSPLQFDAAHNPGASLIPLWSLTDGTNSVSGITGTLPHNWTLFRGSGTGTLSGTVAITNTTASTPNPIDGTVIPSLNLAFTATNNGANTDYLQLELSIHPGANIVAGDMIQASCDASWSGLQNIIQLGMKLDDTVLVSQYQPLTFTYFPPASDTFAGSVPATDAVQPFRLITPLMPLTAASVTANSLSVSIIVGYDASTAPPSSGFGVAAGAVVNLTLRNCQINKVGQSYIQ